MKFLKNNLKILNLPLLKNRNLCYQTLDNKKIYTKPICNIKTEIMNKMKKVKPH